MKDLSFRIASKYLAQTEDTTVDKKEKVEALSDKQKLDIITEVIDRDYNNIIRQYIRRQDTEMLYLVSDFLSKQFSETSVPHDQIFDNLAQYRNRIYNIVEEAALMDDNSIKSNVFNQIKDKEYSEDDIRAYSRRFLIDIRKDAIRYINRISNL